MLALPTPINHVGKFLELLGPGGNLRSNSVPNLTSLSCTKISFFCDLQIDPESSHLLANSAQSWRVEGGAGRSCRLFLGQSWV